MNLRHLEMELERLEGFERPTSRLEQYGTPAPVAARLLHHAADRLFFAVRGNNNRDLRHVTDLPSVRFREKS